MKTLTINIPEGFVVDSFDKESGTVSFKEKPKKVTERIKTVDDLVKEHGIDKVTFEANIKGLSRDEVAYRLLKLLAKSLNEGWEPDWNNSNELKYYPYFVMGGSSGFRVDGDDGWASGSTVGSRLCFKSRELAEYAGQQFVDVYKDFMTYGN